MKIINNSYELNTELNKCEKLLVVNNGVYIGNFVINRPIKLISKNFSIILSNNIGNILYITSSKILINNIIFYNSGKNIIKKNSCIFINKNLVFIDLIGNFFTECGFSIWSDISYYTRFFFNIFVGNIGKILSNRSNNLHLFNNNNVIIFKNFFLNSRDNIYVSNSKEIIICYNILTNSRFGIHYMFNHKSSVLFNIINHSLIGVAIMYSKYVNLIYNYICKNVNYGFFFRNILYSKILNNKSILNLYGMFFSSSYYNDIINNDIVKNFIGLKLSDNNKENLFYINNIMFNKNHILYLDDKIMIFNINNIGNYLSRSNTFNVQNNFIVNNYKILNHLILKFIFNNFILSLLYNLGNNFFFDKKKILIDNFSLSDPLLW